jgi:CubicO group peptidase (beta-lactamase class C family)
MKRSASLLLCLICFASLRSQPGTSLPPFVRDSLDAHVRRALGQWQVPGLAIAVIKDGQVQVLRGYGLREAGKPEPVDEHTLFMIGSNTKAFTATALAMLEAEGKCQLSDPVRRWLPSFTLRDSLAAREVMLADLLCHRIGMETFQGDFMYWTSDLSAQEVVQKLGQLEARYSFRSQWGYCNAAFTSAGECFPAISGQTWKSFLESRIFSPLGMRRTLASSLDLPRAENAARPHTIVDDSLHILPYPAIDNLGPAGSISSSVADMSRWVRALLDSGKWEGRTVLPYAAIQATQQPYAVIGQARHPFNRTNFSLYGLGWELSDYEGRKVVSHTGGVNGFVSSVTLIPSERLGIVVLTNSDANGLFETLKMELMDAYLGLPYRGYSDRYLQNFQPYEARQRAERQAMRDSVAMQLAPAAPLKAFAGRYIHDIYGWAQIEAQKDHLHLTFEHHPSLSARLECLGGSRFLCTYSDPTMGVRVFDFGMEGKKVRSMTLRVADFVEFLPYIFRKES